MCLAVGRHATLPSVVREGLTVQRLWQIPPFCTCISPFPSSLTLLRPSPRRPYGLDAPASAPRLPSLSTPGVRELLIAFIRLAHGPPDSQFAIALDFSHSVQFIFVRYASRFFRLVFVQHLHHRKHLYVDFSLALKVFRYRDPQQGLCHGLRPLYRSRKRSASKGSASPAFEFGSKCAGVAAGFGWCITTFVGEPLENVKRFTFYIGKHWEGTSSRQHE